MFDKIFNRKYLKTIKAIEDELKYLDGREDYYRNELRLGGDYYDAKEAIEMIDAIRQRRVALWQMLQNLKKNLH